MKKKLIIGIIAGVFVAAAAVACVIIFGNTYRDISVFELHNNVELERKGKDVKIFDGMKLRGGDEVSVGEESFSRLMLDEDKLVYLGEGTEAQLKELSGSTKDSVTKILITSGEMITEIREKLSSESVYEIETPNSVMAIRGTVVITRVEKADGEYRISSYCQEGSADIIVYVVEDGETVASKCMLEAGEGLTVTTEEVPEDFAEAVRTEQLGSRDEMVEYLNSVDNVAAEASGMEQYDLGGQDPAEFEGAGGESRIIYLTDEDTEPGDGSDGSGDTTGDSENAGEQPGGQAGAADSEGEEEPVITRIEEFYDEDGWRIVREYSGEELVCESGYDETEDGDGRYYIEHYEDGLAVRRDWYYADGSMYEYGLYYYQDGKLIRVAWYSSDGVQTAESVCDSQEREIEGWQINSNGEKETYLYEYTEDTRITRYFRENGEQYCEYVDVLNDEAVYVSKQYWYIDYSGDRFEIEYENGEEIIHRWYDPNGVMTGLTEVLPDGRCRKTAYNSDGTLVYIDVYTWNEEECTSYGEINYADGETYIYRRVYYDATRENWKEEYYYFPDGTLKAEWHNYEDGRMPSGWGTNRDGTKYTYEYDDSGNLHLKGYFLNGELQSEAIESADGVMLSHWYYAVPDFSGLSEGDTKHIYIYENGTVTREEIYRLDGELKGECFFDETGETVIKSWEVWDDGRRSETFYDDAGVRHQIVYDSNGEVLDTFTYDD